MSAESSTATGHPVPMPLFARERPADRSGEVPLGKNKSGLFVFGTFEAWDEYGSTPTEGPRPWTTFELVRRDDGTVKNTTYRSGGFPHRVGKPARTHYRADGTKRSEDFLLRGQASRIDGPAALAYRPDGSISTAYYYLDDELYSGPDGFVAAVLATKSFTEISDALLAGHLGRFFIAGHRPSDLLAAVGAGLLTAEGVGAVLDGAPVEWARAYEEGRT